MVERRTPSQHKHIPIRTCVVCRTKEGKRSLIRVVRTGTGVQVDPSGKMNGRGAYLCDRRSCWERAVNTNILNQALRATLSDEDRNHLMQAMPVS